MAKKTFLKIPAVPFKAATMQFRTALQKPHSIAEKYALAGDKEWQDLMNGKLRVAQRTQGESVVMARMIKNKDDVQKLKSAVNKEKVHACQEKPKRSMANFHPAITSMAAKAHAQGPLGE